MSTDFTGMIAFAQSLAETVKQAQTATEELAATREQLAAMQRQHDELETERDMLGAECNTYASSVASLRSQLAQSEARNAEVSEALARANAKLDSFRQLLGVDSGAGAPVPTPAVLPEQPTNAVAEPPHEAQRVDPAPAPGTGGVEQDHPPQVNQTAYDFVTAEPASTRHVEPQPEPTPAPEVAEPRPTPPQTGDSHEPSSGPTDDRFGQAQEAAPSRPFTADQSGGTGESWRDHLTLDAAIDAFTTSPTPTNAVVLRAVAKEYFDDGFIAEDTYKKTIEKANLIGDRWRDSTSDFAYRPFSH